MKWLPIFVAAWYGFLAGLLTGVVLTSLGTWLLVNYIVGV